MVSADDTGHFDARNIVVLDEGVNGGAASLKDLLNVIHNAGLADAPSQTAVVLSRIKQVISSSTSRIPQNGKGHLILEVEKLRS